MAGALDRTIHYDWHLTTYMPTKSSPPKKKQLENPNDYGAAIMDGHLSLCGTLGQKSSRTGRLNANIRDMQLAERSIPGKILNALQLNKPTDFIFNTDFREG